jgi:hypothetical protein
MVSLLSMFCIRIVMRIRAVDDFRMGVSLRVDQAQANHDQKKSYV